MLALAWAWFRAKLASIGSELMLVIILVLAAWLALNAIDLKHKDSQISELYGRIASGQAHAATCRANVATLTAAVKQQNDALALQSTADLARLKASQDALAAVLTAQVKRDASLKTLLAPLPTGTSVCDRVLIVDKRLLETLN